MSYLNFSITGVSAGYTSWSGRFEVNDLDTAVESDGGIVEIDPRNDDAAKFFSDVSDACAFTLARADGRREIRGIGGNGQFPCGVHLRQQLRASVIVGGAIVVGLRGVHALQATAGGGVEGVEAQHFFVFALGIVVFAQVVVALGGVEPAAHLVHVLGVLVGQRGLGADRVVQITQFAGGIAVVGIHGEKVFEQRGLRCICRPCGVASPAPHWHRFCGRCSSCGGPQTSGRPGPCRSPGCIGPPLADSPPWHKLRGLRREGGRLQSSRSGGG